MNFITRFDIKEGGGFVGRAYVHPAGFYQVYDGKIENAIGYLKRTIVSESKERGLDMTHAIIWGKEGGCKMIDFLGIHRGGSGEWPGNPDIYQWVVKNGLTVPAQKGVLETTCSQGFRVFGAELEYMNRTPNSSVYLKIAPKIPGLEFERNDMCGCREE